MAIELRENFLKFLKESSYKKCVVNVLGDLFDKKISMTATSAVLVINFIHELLAICSAKNYKLRIILGTKSHDLSQLAIFSNLTFTSVDPGEHDFNIYYNVTKEEIFSENLQVLYLPEEYVVSQEEYYKNFFNKQYDIVFGHGTISHVAFKNQKILSEKPIQSAPVFDANTLSKLSKSYVVFGHIHVHQKYKNILIPGSFSRWAYGETKDKGFLIITYNSETGKKNFDFIVNDLAPKYNTINFNDVEGSSIEEKIKSINELKKKYKNLRIVNDNKDLDVTILETHFKNDDNIKIQNKANQLLQEEDEEENQEYMFLNKDSLEIEEKIRKYIKTKFGVKIKTEFIKDFIFEKASK
jgi:hypothetical protein